LGYRSRARAVTDGQLARDATEADARAAALAADGIAARLAGQAVRKFVYVPGQVVNLVVG
jgi:leucyl-tRNA synthetase